MQADAANSLRRRAILVAREAKWIVAAVPERFARAIAGRWLVGLLLRWLFVGPDGKPHRAGEIVLAELRRSAGLERASIFDPDATIMAYREGRRSMMLEIFNYLNLDEEAVQQLMRLDDGE